MLGPDGGAVYTICEKGIDEFKSAVDSSKNTPSHFDSEEQLKTEVLLAIGNWQARGRV